MENTVALHVCLLGIDSRYSISKYFGERYAQLNDRLKIIPARICDAYFP